MRVSFVFIVVYFKIVNDFNTVNLVLFVYFTPFQKRSLVHSSRQYVLAAVRLSRDVPRTSGST